VRRMDLMTAGGVTLAGLGALVGLAINSGAGGHTLVAQHSPAVEVRTEVIRRTVNVYRRTQPHHVAGSGTGRASPRGAVHGTTSATYSGAAAARTRASGATAGTGAQTAPSGASVVRTRSSGATSKPTSGSESGTTKALTVRTRTSGGSTAGSGAGTSKPLSTRSSGSGGDGHGGGHDD
jgi:hypothetical protein